MTLKTYEINPEAAPIASIIWLHGLGANSQDFAPIVPILRLPKTLPIRFIFPDAPNRPVSINNGWIMPAWYDIYSLNRDGPEDEDGIVHASSLIGKLIDQEISRGISADSILLAGFSQGGALASYTALTYPVQLGGLLSLSAYLPIAKKLEQNLSAINRHLPIFLAHGTADDILSFDIGEASHEFLKNLGYNVTWKSYVMAHEVCPQEIMDISNWIQQALSKKNQDIVK